MKIPKITDYMTAFAEIRNLLSDDEIRMLKIHHNSPEHTTTAEIMSEAMGYVNYGGANLQYGRLAGKLCNHLNVKSEFKLEILCNFVPPFEHGDNVHWLWVMRPEVVEALERLGWVEHSQFDKNVLIDRLSEFVKSDDKDGIKTLLVYWVDDDNEPDWLAAIMSNANEVETFAAKTVAKLFAFYPSISNDSENFGWSAKRLLEELSPNGDPYGIQKRFRLLFRMSLADEILLHDLTWFVRMFVKHGVQINWITLFDDLKLWGKSARSVQKEWATEFWTKRSSRSMIN